MSEGHPNYITPEGARRLQGELSDLRSKQRPKVVQDVADAAAQGDRSENAEYIYGKRKLREIDRRIHYLTKRLEAATVVAPRTDGEVAVYFGAFVEVEDDEGVRTEYRIVGEDEIDLGRRHVSWRSPLGRALLRRRAGDSIVLKKPNGEAELTVVAVRY
ncbi:MAG TPA: transcription elongation factor GreB [Polyangiaceae bacterium]|nr:transcription elongation factor GreB [Polyangiaceae bacterium]